MDRLWFRDRRSIYIVEAENGVVKIGCTSNVKLRVATIMGHSPVRVRLIAQLPGLLPDERALHQRFSRYRCHCEWFSVEGELAEYLATVRGVGLEDPIPAWDELTYWQQDGRARSAARMSDAQKRAWANPEYRAKRKEWLGRLKQARANDAYKHPAKHGVVS